MTIEACDDCLRRTELLGWLSGRIEIEWRLRRGRPQLLALSDEELLDWSRDSEAAKRYRGFAPSFARDRLTAAGLGAICHCAAPYPAGLLELPDPPAVLHVLGDAGALTGEGVALVGARDASPYGKEISRRLARSLAVAGVTVVSGMAMGVDAAAHEGALEAARLRAAADRVPGVDPEQSEAGRTVAVLATGADRPYPARFRALHAEIARTGCVVSEMPPGSAPRRWAFPARNRLIAALSCGTVVIEGGERSGSLITADFAADLGRFVAAVPGPVTSRLSAGPHALLKAGAEVVRSSADVLDLVGAAEALAPVAHTVIGAGQQAPPERRLGPLPDRATPPPDLPPALRRLLIRVERGEGSLAELVTSTEDSFAISRDLGELEVRGLIRRISGGRYIRALD